MHKIDLNSDLGESFGAWKMGNDGAMLEIVTSANIACGFHAGDPVGILATLKQAVANNVVVGAHVGYRDLAGFGRRNMDPSSQELKGDVIYQIGALQGLAKVAGAQVRYVKPHGALYNTIADDMRQAKDVIEAILELDRDLVLMALANAPICDLARSMGLNVVGEVFADRAYTSDGKLVSRREKGATLHDAEMVSNRILRFVETGTLTSIDGTLIKIDAQSICLHGDNPDAVTMARAIREKLDKAGIVLKSFI